MPTPHAAVALAALTLGLSACASPVDGELVSMSVMGSGPCARVALGDVVLRVHEIAPSLEDFNLLRSQNNKGDPDDIVAFMRDDGGFDLAFVARSGCGPIRCGIEQRWYFTTDEHCMPVELGAFVRDWRGKCWDVAGIPLWDEPVVNPDEVCQE